MASAKCYQARQLHASDYDKGFLEVLAHLTTVGEVSRETFEEQLKRMDAAGGYRTVVVEDEGRVVATASMVVELKFIHACGKVGHIEDVVVDPAHRGKNLGLVLVGALVDAAREMGCYKVILDCAEANVAFYEKCGLTRKEVQMVGARRLLASALPGPKHARCCAAALLLAFLLLS
ncbi:Glucosamine 6-phosphate N-acetyltransferase [Tetrabaena socialis]|uniref:Glucosamine 6-phosphate N-acetyltransferase n=1 Tax=Tetrabaena socialis TaxID=47790 RepID=A0A2J8AK16_9CHLO|nr:Glucosamine 6-phosphate N-acetyltransferase [Tetrabaena socialis]|eukprot:PNH12865.1 Glucosamine 6-phosphate N-acetyltransferase [Tetrabaena socialis]